jgi:hypothetical protein
VGVYVWDTIDDLRVVNNFQAHQKTVSSSLARMEFCLCLTDHLDDGTVNMFKSQGAALIAEDVNTFLECLEDS